VIAMSDVERATGLTATRLLEAKDQAIGLKNELDAMPRDIQINIAIAERRTISSVALPTVFEDMQHGKAPGQAAGTSNWEGGMTWVGERGPELVNLPRGAQVYDAQKSQNIANTYHNYDVTVNTAAQSGTYMQDIALAQAMAQ